MRIYFSSHEPFLSETVTCEKPVVCCLTVPVFCVLYEDEGPTGTQPAGTTVTSTAFITLRHGSNRSAEIWGRFQCWTGH